MLAGFVMLLFGLSLWAGPGWFRKIKMRFMPMKFSGAKPGFNSLKDVYGEEGSKGISKLFSVMIIFAAISLLISGFFV